MVEIGDNLSSSVREHLWPNLAHGGIIIDSTTIMISNEDNLYVQAKNDIENFYKISLKKDRKDKIRVSKIAATEKDLFYSAFSEDEAVFHLYKLNRQTREVTGPVRRLPRIDGVFITEGNKMVTTGNKKDDYLKHVFRRYKPDYDESVSDAEIAEKRYYENHEISTITIYDEGLNEELNLNQIQRTGENLRAFDRAYVMYPADYSAQKQKLYIIDNSEGYVIKKYSLLTGENERFQVEHKKYKEIPSPLTIERIEKFKKVDASYSVPYFIYEKNGFIISGFYQTPILFKEITPPFYYDISLSSGDHVATGVLKYPIIAEDQMDKVFAFYRLEGGWFQDDRLFLVGFSVKELLSGEVSNQYIEDAVAKYINK